jgi:hypothetical protein
MMLHDIHDLKARGARPRVHGNGFIQLDLDPEQRLHIWGHPDIPKQSVPTPIHDHVFGFHSELLIGRLVNVVYDFMPIPYEGETWEVYEPEVRHGEDTVLQPTGETGSVRMRHAQLLVAGSSFISEYDFAPFVFHEMFAPEPSATIITKRGPTLRENPTGRKPRVLVPEGVEPDNEFDRYNNDPNDLWRIIIEVLEL